MVRHGRQQVALDGVIVRGSRRFDESVQLHLSPPRQQYDDAIIELADRSPDELTAIATLADACGGRRTTAARLLSRLEGMSRLHRRSWLKSVLRDVAEGTCVSSSSSTAAKLGRLLQLRGWRGAPTRCPSCEMQDRRGLRQPG
ncbi:MAG: hypothetical protein NTX33_04140 [Propionibacteriales bacterium]|nr:hypothetical protein [Propionibacteriales bacterium]